MVLNLSLFTVDPRQDIVRKCLDALQANQECYIAKIILDNPDMNLLDYTLVHRPLKGGNEFGYSISLERKENVRYF